MADAGVTASAKPAILFHDAITVLSSHGGAADSRAGIGWADNECLDSAHGGQEKQKYLHINSTENFQLLVLKLAL